MAMDKILGEMPSLPTNKMEIQTLQLDCQESHLQNLIGHQRTEFPDLFKSRGLGQVGIARHLMQNQGKRSGHHLVLEVFGRHLANPKNLALATRSVEMVDTVTSGHLLTERRVH